MPEIHLSDVGTRFDFTFTDEAGERIPLDQATTVDAVFRLPDRTTLRRALTVTDAVVDGLAVYYVVEGELSLPGLWRVQGIVETPSGLWHSGVQRFTVARNIPELETSP